MKSKSNPLVWSLAFVVVTVSYGLSQNSRPPLFSTGVVSNSLTIGFPTQSGASYTIQAAADLANPDWTNTQTVAGTGAIVTVPTAITQQQQYFRLLISAPPASSLDPTQIGPPGSLYAYWNFNDLSVSNAVTAWTDRINGIVLQPPGVPPVDTALGVYFNSTPDPLTNSALAIGSNFTLWIVFRPNMIDSNARVVFGTAAGQGLVISNGLLYGDWDSTNMLSVPLNHAYPGDTNETFDLIDACGTLYTNGLLCTAGVGQPNDYFPFSGLGSDISTNNFSGYVQYVGIWTNYQFTQSDVTALDIWVNTNGVTNVTGGLLAWYRLDDGTGTNCADSSGNGNTATFIGSPAWVPGLAGDALSFTGNGQALNAGNVADNLPAFSTSFWITTFNFWDGAFALQHTGSSELAKESGLDYGQGWGVFSDAPWDIKGYVENFSNWYESPPIELNSDYWGAKWHHVVCNFFYQVPLVDIYLDGVLCTGENGPAEMLGGTLSSISTTFPLYIGGDPEGHDTSCEMDDVRVYNRPLSSQEIAILYRWRREP
jgi:hypothetical protein